MTGKTPRHLRSVAYAAVLRRLRAEFPREYRVLLFTFRESTAPTQKASIELRQRHAERAAKLYSEEVTARGLPSPRPQTGRWPILDTKETR